MTRFYKHAWTSTEGEIIVNGKYGDGFIEWCKETEHLTDEQWKKGFQSIKDEIAANKIAGKDSWPPNYIEFVAMCQPEGIAPRGVKNDRHVSGNSDSYLSIHDPRHSMNRAARPEYGESDRLKLTGTTYESKRKKAARRELDAMLASLADVKTKDEIDDEGEDE